VKQTEEKEKIKPYPEINSKSKAIASKLLHEKFDPKGFFKANEKWSKIHSELE
jgi:hypothetical protein